MKRKSEIKRKDKKRNYLSNFFIANYKYCITYTIFSFKTNEEYIILFLFFFENKGKSGKKENHKKIILEILNFNNILVDTLLLFCAFLQSGKITY